MNINRIFLTMFASILFAGAAMADGTTRIREAKAGDLFYGDALTHASENIGDTDARQVTSDTIFTNRQRTKTISCVLKCGAIRKHWRTTN